MMVVVPSLVIGVFLFLYMLNNVYSQTYEIERFNRSKDTIRSPITIENETETERKTRESVQSVEDRYTIKEDITEDQIDYIDEIFDAINSLTKDNNKSTSEKDTKDDSKNDTDDKLSNEEIVSKLDDILSDEITNNINDVVFMQLVGLDSDEREQGKKIFTDTLQKVLDNGVRIENISSAKEEVQSSIKYATLDQETKDALEELVDFARSEEHTSELQSRGHLVCRLLLEK